MAEYYLDSSAPAKRYVAEPGSDWIRSLVSPSRRNLTLTARITGFVEDVLDLIDACIR